MKTLGVIALVIASIGLVLFFVLIMPADRRGEAACIEEMREIGARAQPVKVTGANLDTEMAQFEAARHADGAPASEVDRACEEHRRQATPMRVLGIVIFLTFVAGMFMYKRGLAAGAS